MHADIKTLLVDDDTHQLEVTAEFLDRISDTIVTDTQTDPEQAVADLTTPPRTYECVVCDYNMPEMTGLDVLEAVRENDPDIPFILHTGRGSEEIASDAISAGVTDYVQKESGKDHYRVLANRIENAVSQRRTSEKLGETSSKIEALHETAADIASCTDQERLYDIAIEASEQILEFDVSLVSKRDGDVLVPVAVSEGVPNDGYYDETPVDASDNIAARCYRTQDSAVVDDIHAQDVDPAETDYRSALTVPVGEYAVFQAAAEAVGRFDDRDLELAEILFSHVRAALSRVESAQNQRRERERFAALFELIPHAIGVGRIEDATPKVTDVNPAFEETFGWDSDTFEEGSVDDYLVPEDEQAQAKSINRTMEKGGTIEGREIQRMTADGLRDFLFHAAKLPVEENEGFVVYTDITELKRRERELRRQNEQLDELASFVSHDLKNPLHVVDGATELLKEDIDRPELDTLSDAVDTLGSRVGELQELTEHGRIVLDPATVELGAVVEQAWENVDSRDATLQTGDLSMTVEGDRDRLCRLFENLCSNAIRHGGPDVTITVDSLDDRDGFFVEDTGVGYDGDHDTLFDPSSDTGGRGTQIVASIADTHDWTVSAEPSQSGGLCVTVAFTDTHRDEPLASA